MNTIYRRVLVVVVMASGCDGAPAEPITAAAEVEVRLVRAQASELPESADSAVIRIWNRQTGFNLARAVAVPEAGEQSGRHYQGRSSGDSIIVTLNAPDVETDTTAWFAVGLETDAGDNWGRYFWVQFPSIGAGDGPLSRPLVPPGTDGSITVVF